MTPRLRLGALTIDRLSFDGALDAIEALVDRGEGGMVLTPNVDHVVLCEDEPRLAAAYADASLSLVDGTPVVWASHLLGEPLPAKVSGSDLVRPLLSRAARRGLRVYLLGGPEGAGQRAAQVLATELPSLHIVGIDAPRVDVDRDPSTHDEIVARIVAARPHLVLCAFGCPKQEILMHRLRQAVRPAVLLGVGASIEFLAGMVPRAPRWVAVAGLEWLYRLAHEPRRLWRRYLVRDPRFVVILGRALWARLRGGRLLASRAGDG